MSNEEKNSGFNRVVITGMGAISPAGFGVDALWSKVASGECCFTLLPEEKREQLNAVSYTHLTLPTTPYV